MMTYRVKMSYVTHEHCLSTLSHVDEKHRSVTG